MASGHEQPLPRDPASVGHRFVGCRSQSAIHRAAPSRLVRNWILFSSRTMHRKLRSDVFRVSPRLDLLHRNVVWQETYRKLNLVKMLSKAEMVGPIMSSVLKQYSLPGNFSPAPTRSLGHKRRWGEPRLARFVLPTSRRVVLHTAVRDRTRNSTSSPTASG